MREIKVFINYLGIVLEHTIKENGDCLHSHNNKWLCNLNSPSSTDKYRKDYIYTLQQHYDRLK